MSIDRRQFLRGVLASGVVVVGAGAVTAQTAQASSTQALGSAESFLLATGRRALG